ncbi:hypothetical protein RHMOL_Rhmol07G0183500 [Rhododendron molle]|uniref:Uncharacterized protein n=1 Tax=Rhododendron molle TaxID=49168 RepID=A0ACC0N1V8_RHOML|nr:hypothetical protein RHMOL_Rhmol07G0183500 [Rhododendron molle]
MVQQLSLTKGCKTKTSLSMSSPSHVGPAQARQAPQAPHLLGLPKHVSSRDLPYTSCWCKL